MKSSGQYNQIKGAAFQKIAAEEAGLKVARAFIIHLNKDYVRQGDIDPEQLLIFAEFTTDVAEIEAVTRAEIDGALELLALHSIDGSSFLCLKLTKSNHCDAFDYLNITIPRPSIFTLLRISKTKIAGFVADGRFHLDEFGLDEVTDKQIPVLQSAHLKTPIIDQAAIVRFFNKAAYPIYFFGHETYSSAIPIVDCARPQASIPFQYILHVKRTPEDTELLHVEYLAEAAAMPLAMIEHMQSHVGATGSLVSWHASFENT
jgi:hypothetical protein